MQLCVLNFKEQSSTALDEIATMKQKLLRVTDRDHIYTSLITNKMEL